MDPTTPNGSFGKDRVYLSGTLGPLTQLRHMSSAHHISAGSIWGPIEPIYSKLILVRFEIFQANSINILSKLQFFLINLIKLVSPNQLFLGANLTKSAECLGLPSVHSTIGLRYKKAWGEFDFFFRCSLMVCLLQLHVTKEGRIAKYSIWTRFRLSE